MRMILGLVTPTAGSATVNGVRYADLPHPSSTVGTHDIDLNLGIETGTIVGLLLRIAVLMAVYTVLGVAFGALLRNQVTALVVVGGHLYFGETLLLLIPGVNAIYPFLPGGAGSALTGFTFLAEAANQAGTTTTHLLSAPMGALVLLSYVLVASVLAFAAPLRRDVT